MKRYLLDTQAAVWLLDPFDRSIIATAISRGLTLISSDSKFPWYRDHCGLNLMEI